MALLKEYREYLVKEMAKKFNLDLDFASVFIEEVEKAGKITGFEEMLKECSRYGQIYNHYFGRKY